MEDTPTIVMDNGTAYSKLGYAGNLDPSYILPSYIATRDKAPKRNNMVIDELDYFIGDEAKEKKKDATNWNVRKIMRNGVIDDWDAVEKYWHKSMYQYLRCDPTQHNFILTEPPMNPPETREQVAEIMFETFGVKGLYIGIQAVLALYSQLNNENGGNGLELSEDDLTGVVLDSGDGCTHIFPVQKGYVTGSCVRSVPLAGSHITEFIMKRLADRGETKGWFGADIKDEAQRIKEKYCYVADNLIKEYRKYDEPQIVENADGTKTYALSNKFKKHQYKPSNGKPPIEIDIAYERFLGPEIFFHPEFFETKENHKTPIDEHVDDCIQSCDMLYRKDLYKNIVLSGGSTTLKDFGKKLNKLVSQHANNRVNKYAEMVNAKVPEGQEKFKPTPIEVNVKENALQKYAVWFGGSYLGAREDLQNIYKTRATYEEYGPAAFRDNSVFGSGV